MLVIAFSLLSSHLLPSLLAHKPDDPSSRMYDWTATGAGGAPSPQPPAPPPTIHSLARGGPTAKTSAQRPACFIAFRCVGIGSIAHTGMADPSKSEVEAMIVRVRPISFVHSEVRADMHPDSQFFVRPCGKLKTVTPPATAANHDGLRHSAQPTSKSGSPCTRPSSPRSTCRRGRCDHFSVHRFFVRHMGVRPRALRCLWSGSPHQYSSLMRRALHSALGRRQSTSRCP